MRSCAGDAGRRAAQERGIGGIHDRVDLECRDIAEDCTQLRQENLLMFMIRAARPRGCATCARRAVRDKDHPRRSAAGTSDLQAQGRYLPDEAHQRQILSLDGLGEALLETLHRMAHSRQIIRARDRLAQDPELAQAFTRVVMTSLVAALLAVRAILTESILFENLALAI